MNKIEKIPTWDEYFIEMSKLVAKRSNCVSRKVGAVITVDNQVVTTGYNGAPNGFCDDSFPWEREGSVLNTKYAFVCHAEMNAILNYRGSRKELENSKIYVDLFPCNECAKEIIQAGISEVIYLSDKYANTNSVIASKRLFDACNVSYHELKNIKHKEVILTLKK